MELTKPQEKAIAEHEHNLQIIACAGSGKTEVITRRIAKILEKKKDITPANIVAFTFTKKAAESMRARIESAVDSSVLNLNEMYIGTIHSFCWNILSKYSDEFSDFEILNSAKDHMFVHRYAKDCGYEDLDLKVDRHKIRLFMECIDKMIDDFSNRDQWSETNRKVLDKYIKCMYEHKFISFPLLIHETLRQIEINPKVRDYLSTIKYLVVDEYQDVDDIQERLIAEIAKFGTNICVVGDDDQTIYQFRGSNAENMIHFSERYQDVLQVRMQDNFRCSSKIVAIADRVIRNNTRRLDKTMVSACNYPDSIVEVSCYEDESDQYSAIANKINELHKNGLAYSEIAILIRKGKYVSSLTEQLDAMKVPYIVDNSESVFSGVYFQKLVYTLKQLTDLNADSLQKCWGGIFDRKAITAGFRCLRKHSRGGPIPLSKIVTEFCEAIGFLAEDSPDIEERKPELNGIITILDDYDAIHRDYQLSKRITDINYFLDDLAEFEYKNTSFIDSESNTDAVQIMTVHKSKGLQFDTVFLPQLMEGEFPGKPLGGQKYWHVLKGNFEENRSKYESDIEDERKLFYVAVTRAKKNLFMSYQGVPSTFILEADL